MAILIRFVPKAMNAEQYDAVKSKLEEQGPFPPDGMELHVCFGSDDQLKVSEVWENQEKLDAFTERLMPILGEQGIEMGDKPELLEVHNFVTA